MTVSVRWHSRPMRKQYKGTSSPSKRPQLSISLLKTKQYGTSHLSVLVLLPHTVRYSSNSDNEVTDHSFITDDLIVDTGRYGSFASMNWITSTGHSSSNTWIGSGRPYVRTPTSVRTYNSVVCTVDSCRTTHQTHQLEESVLWFGKLRRYASLSAQFERLANLYSRSRVQGHCYPRHADYTQTIYRCCNQGKFKWCDHDEQCTHF